MGQTPTPQELERDFQEYTSYNTEFGRILRSGSIRELLDLYDRESMLHYNPEIGPYVNQRHLVRYAIERRFGS